jgi:hypothetical protein
MGECRGCRWWVPDEDYTARDEPDLEAFGECGPMRYSDVDTRPREFWAYASPDPRHDGDATLRTHPTFGCNQWTPKEPS